MNSIVLAGGCFWGTEKFFQQFPGLKTVVGYANGRTANPTYRQVIDGSGHTEAVKIEYPDSIKLPQILAAYFSSINPTSLNRQGNDIGINYRTGIYSNNETELEEAKAMIEDLQKHYDQPIAVEVLPLENFYTAEEYHQNYLNKNPGGYCHLPPRLMSGHRLPTMGEVLGFYPSLQRFFPDVEPVKVA